MYVKMNKINTVLHKSFTHARTHARTAHTRLRN